MKTRTTAIFTIGMLLCSIQSFGQFTYIEGGINNTTVLYNTTGYTNSGTFSNNFGFRVNVISRIVRLFGLGGELNVPLIKTFNFDFKDSYTPDGSFFFDFKDRYAHQKMEYSIENSISGVVFGRIYLSTILNPYLDVKLSFGKVTERFVFNRAYVSPEYGEFNYKEEIPAIYIKKIIEHKKLVPGFAIGIQPHVSESIFMNFNIGVDIYNYGNSGGFSYDIPHDWDTIWDTHKIVRIESKATNTRAGILFNLGAGYYF